ncbi:acyl-CoA dehydrogenase family protein [Streptomyces sp. NPDC002580]|uniref:acyl-CoA dehydrogenase family protein n=1 Tax=Streptomyces sp. NPDC002580 TaxID=3364653 RepID=UPI003684B306
MSYRSSLSAVLAKTVAPTAEAAVRGCGFPRALVAALGRAGLLGLTVSTEFGGAGLGLAEAVDVVARTARVCPATAAVLTAHFAAVAAVESCGGRPWVRCEIAAGRHLGSLALADGSPGGKGVARVSHGSPYSVASRSGDVIALRGWKRQVVAAGEADSYLWSSRPVAGRGGLTLWVVPAQAPHLFVPAGPGRGADAGGAVVGGGTAGGATSTVCADPVLFPADVMLGPDGGGLDILLRIVRPWLTELRAAAGADILGVGHERDVAEGCVADRCVGDGSVGGGGGRDEAGHDSAGRDGGGSDGGGSGGAGRDGGDGLGLGPEAEGLDLGSHRRPADSLAST